jgi:outer membrane protein assembly factor BamB
MVFKVLPLVFTLACLSQTVPALKVQYFRSDGGVASPSGPLPDNLDSPEVLRWRVAMDSGHSTPIVVGQRIILTTYREESRNLATLALNTADGQVVWKKAAPAERIERTHRVGSPAAVTPACDGERLYVFFGSYGLICYDLDGKQLWTHPMGPFQDEFGAGSSPVLIDGKVIIGQDHDVDSFVMALDAKTGKVLWRQPRPDAVRSYSTPVVWNRDGRKELLVAGALAMTSYNPDNGEKLWWTHGLARIVIPLPVPSGDMVYMASWAPGADAGGRISLEAWDAALSKWDKNSDSALAKAEVDDKEVLDRFYRMDLDQSGTLNQKEWDRHADVFRRAQNAILALKPFGPGQLSESDIVWKYQRGVPYVATPLLHNQLIWMVKDGGLVTKLDANDGKVLKEERLPGFGNYYASPVTGDGKVYFASELGVVSILQNDRAWNVISWRNFKEKIYATPVIDGDKLYIRTEKALYCFQERRIRA